MEKKKVNTVKKVDKILFVNGINYWNIGDLGITDAMITTFTKYFPGAVVNIVTPYYYWRRPEHLHVEFEASIHEDIFIFPGQDEREYILKKIYFFLSSIFTLFGILFYLCIYSLFGKKYRFLLGTRYTTMQLYHEADIIVSKGGGFLFDHGRFLLSPHAFPLIVGFVLQKKTIIYAQSLGPFKRKISKILYKAFFKKVDVIIVRERISQNIMKEEFGIYTLLGTDAAFGLEETQNHTSKQLIDEKIAHIRSQKQRIVGMSMLQRHFPYVVEKEKKNKLEQYKKSMAEAINILNKDTYFMFFPHSIAGTESDDRDIIKKVINMSGITDNFDIIETEYNPRSLVYTLSNIDFCVGTRMHSNIFTLLGRTPLIAISYLPKTTGIMQEMKLADLVIHIDRINPQIVQEKIDYLTSNLSQISKTIDEGILRMKKNEINNFTYIEEVL